MLSTLLIATITGLATALGVIPFLFRERIPRWLYDTLLGVGAGLMISAATLGLLGAALEQLRPDGHLHVSTLAQIVAGFALGVGLMFVLDHFIPHQHAGGHGEHIGQTRAGTSHGCHPAEAHGRRAHAGHPHGRGHAEEVRQGLLLVGAMTLHRLPEGFAIGAGFAAGLGETLGTMLAVAVAFQNMCEGAVMAAPLRHAGWSRTKTLFTVAATGLAVPAAAALGYAFGTHVSTGLPFALALASGALIHLISNEIIPETHSHGNEKLATAGLVAGFLVTIVIRALGHTH